jgi:hypothetical protein
MVSFAPNILLHYGQSYIQRRKAPNELTKTMTGCCLFFSLFRDFRGIFHWLESRSIENQYCSQDVNNQ